jgi:1-acyl-sn-glycerol-3-phosphate acyltransferase
MASTDSAAASADGPLAGPDPPRSWTSDPSRTGRSVTVATERTRSAVDRGVAATEAPRGADLASFCNRALQRGVSPALYRLARLVLVPFFRVYFRLSGTGAKHVPACGPVILAANHRSFLDPFVIGALVRRPVYYMAKRELFERPLQARLLSALGAFPIDRGASDEQAMATAAAILARGDCLVIFPEGTRIRRPVLGTPHRGVGRLALQSGAPVVPIALIGTDRVRRGFRVLPCKVRLRFGRPLAYPVVRQPSAKVALWVTERIWACVSLQWQWLGGEVPAREPAELPQGMSAVGGRESTAGDGAIAAPSAGVAPRRERSARAA